MSTYTLEGDDLEHLLARVPDELGPDATIVAANKLRSGGIAGFFSKEAYEVVVEVDDGSAPGPAVEDFAFPELPDDGSTESTVPALIASPKARTGRGARASRDEGFAAVLGRMVRDAGDGDRAPESVLVAHGQDEAGFGLAPTPAPAPASADPIAPSELLPARSPSPVRRSAPVAIESFDRRRLSRIGLPDTLATSVAATTGDATMALLHLFDRLPRPDALPQAQGSVIAVLGNRQAAVEIAERFAQQLGTNPSDVLVATRTGRAKLDDDRRIDSVDTALERRRSWRRRRRPTVVAIESAVGRKHTSWAANLLEALEPTQVWGVVEATRKAEDIRDWAVQVGGLDALAVLGLDDTASPATVLSVGVPVGLLDGEEATPLRWTSIVTARLLEAA
ncbi:MAG: hypothetical protein M3Z03_14135 [Actinomycetota bacterium]|nr:hypothetical protein [Actinomycetota bacterium]